MQARVSKWGKSLAIRLPQAAVKSLRPPGRATGLPI